MAANRNSRDIFGYFMPPKEKVDDGDDSFASIEWLDADDIMIAASSGGIVVRETTSTTSAYAITFLSTLTRS